MARVVVVGGGWAGCAAALSARQAGSQATLLERTDLLLGAGLVGGIMLNNGRLTAALESKALGGGLIFEALEGIYRHRKIDFPGHKHASLYDIIKVEPLIRRLLRENGVDIRLQSRIVGVEQAAARVEGVILATGDTIAGDAFVDATGTSGPPGHCWRYGHGCALCAQRCHAFGPRMSVVKMAGKRISAQEAKWKFGAMSGSWICPESLSPETAPTEDRRSGGDPLPKQLVRPEKLKLKVCQQYALDEYAANIVLLDTGSVKMMAPFIPLSALKKVPGFEQARYLDPLAGGIGNSMRLLAMAYRDDSLKVDGLDNLFVAGEKQGPAVGHTEAIVTGPLAGHNAVRHAVGQKLLVLPSTLALGALVRAISSDLENNQPGRQSYTFAGAVFFQTMVERNLYDTDPKKVAARVDAAGLSGIYRRPLPS